MTQILTTQQASIQSGPRGLGARATGGAYTFDCQTDIIEGDALQGPVTLLSGTTDAICPVINPVSGAHAGGNFVIKTAGVDAITLPTPVATIDDGLSVAIYSDTTNAHTVTAASACIANGAALNTVVTFKAFRGSGVQLRAFNGTWQVMASNVTSIV